MDYDTISIAQVDEYEAILEQGGTLDPDERAELDYYYAVASYQCMYDTMEDGR